MKQRITTFGKTLFVIDVKNKEHKEQIEKLKKVWNNKIGEEVEGK